MVMIEVHELLIAAYAALYILLAETVVSVYSSATKHSYQYSERHSDCKFGLYLTTC